MNVAVLEIRAGDAIAEAKTLIRMRHPYLVRYREEFFFLGSIGMTGMTVDKGFPTV